MRKEDVPHALPGAVSWIVRDAIEQQKLARHKIGWDIRANNLVGTVFKRSVLGNVMAVLMQCTRREHSTMVSALYTVAMGLDPTRSLRTWECRQVGRAWQRWTSHLNPKDRIGEQKATGNLLLSSACTIATCDDAGDEDNVNFPKKQIETETELPDTDSHVKSGPKEDGISDLHVHTESGPNELGSEEMDTGKWRDAVGKVINAIFPRYDLDASGTINSMDEAEMMTVNTIAKLKLSVRHDLLVENLAVLRAIDLETQEFSPESFAVWFSAHFPSSSAS